MRVLGQHVEEGSFCLKCSGTGLMEEGETYARRCGGTGQLLGRGH